MFIQPYENINYAYNDYCLIEWQNNEHASIKLNGLENITYSLFSIIIDNSINYYYWLIPWYITKFWQTNFYFTKTNLQNGIIENSPFFNIYGGTILTEFNHEYVSGTLLNIKTRNR